ncbi:F0F1 ATP synthase subunit A [Marmoricola sp. URHB0036]|uniref:F0F1 ATP synthase subunit A n=1 Tax=Marmoricola sp. URHB0036 TaxID=1298863 RepID=UPI00042629AE|nr:F0F1 ATP synthase subunit A [Marmoricola sp. URHB0036]
MTSAVIAPLAIEIHPGEHPEGHFLGMTFNLDTIWVTVVAGAIVVALGFWARAKLTEETPDHVPTKIQLVWETIIDQVTTQVTANLGKVNPFVIPLATALFFFILIANWLEVIPTELNSDTHLLPSPTADTNLTYAMAALVIVGVWTFGVRQKGLKGYLKHFLEPYPYLLPLNILEELVKPITLALRLFGNIFAGGIMLGLIAGLVSLAPSNIPVGPALAIILNVIWKLFDTMFLGGLQAFIFALLTVLYFGMAGGDHGDHDEQDEHVQHDQAEQKSAEPEPAH